MDSPSIYSAQTQYTTRTSLISVVTSSRNHSTVHVNEYMGEDEVVGEKTVIEQRQSHDLEQLVNARLLRYVKWTESESGWIRLKKESEVLTEDAKLGTVIEKKFKESFAGEMLYHLNKNQPVNFDLQEKKLDIIKHCVVLNEFPNTYERLNFYVDNIVDLIEKCIKSNDKGMITLRSLLKNTPLLRFSNCQISMFDSSLRRYENLQALILASNYLQDFPGSLLPRNLKMLELYGNFLNKTEFLCNEAPQFLLYLGIGRNYLSGDCGLKNLLSLQYLSHLDLSDNDLQNLDEVLNIFSKFARLESLELMGNPCSLSISYKRKVQIALTTLKYLDGELLEPSGKKKMQSIISTENISGDACLQVYGLRIMGLKQLENNGKKKSKVKGTYRLEIELPLLDASLKELELERIIMEETEEIVNEDESEPPEVIMEIPVEPITPFGYDATTENPIENISENKQKVSKKVDTKESEKKKEIKAITDKYDTYLLKDKPYPVENMFVSKDIKWAQVMEFPSPCIEVPIPESMLVQLRDTFRSIVTVRLVRIENEKKGKKTNGTNKNKKKNASFELKEPKGKGKGSIVTEPKVEDIITHSIAKISVPLQMLKWNEKHVGYSWDMNNFCLAKHFPNILNVKYKKQTKQNKSSKKPKIDIDRKEEDNVMEIPSYLTCHLAIGLQRDTDSVYVYGTKPTVKSVKISVARKNYIKKKAPSLKRHRMEETFIELMEKLIKRKEIITTIKEEFKNYEASLKKLKEKSVESKTKPLKKNKKRSMAIGL